MEVLFGDGPEAMTSTMKRMMTLQEERTKRMAAVHARYQAALTAARAQHMARFQETQKQMHAPPLSPLYGHCQTDGPRGQGEPARADEEKRCDLPS
ncbi:hypothetical protein CDD80_4017 [Ophiocordyceps camponoti-rufipedis]|uniref:Uncharacterized protein n=1 Tax=Ophiocordyceps camponoti-rufipedis TaxID=2004952 RepID=A0A2C5YZU4_9HYPO|nr:hypothetical protein CDD80_4017 [Ophiocordyceps camponoti-rufipedis]